MRIISITKSFEFHAAHFLPDHPGKCKSTHGHSFKLEVTVQSNKLPSMVIDFSDLKEMVNEHVIDLLDHKLLNDIIPNPTAEELLYHIANALEGEVENYNLKLIRLKLWETDTSYATLEMI